MKLCGLDEVGRGAIAGPFVAAAVLVTAAQEKTIKKSRLAVKDSKCLTPKQREHIFEYVCTLGIQNSVIVYPVTRINIFGIGDCNMQAFKTLIHTIPADNYCIDGKQIPIMSDPQIQSKITSLIDADAIVFPVMIASIIAKVIRDRLMNHFHQHYPVYGWNTNAGYGTTQHIDALLKHGTTPLHRTQFTATAITTRKNTREDYQ